MEYYGNVFNIQRFSVQDGFGVRTLVFLKGCPLRCEWCCNPESQNMNPVLLYQKMRCVHCQRCVQACPQKAVQRTDKIQLIDRDKCNECGKCAETCFTGALEMSGSRRSLEEVYAEVSKDLVLYQNSGGGITLSGGEPFLQHEFARELLKKCKANGINTAVETCGCVPWESIADVLPYIDLFLYDIKHMVSEIHERFTGVGNQQILENLRKIVKAGKRAIVRLPIIPGVNDNMEHIQSVMAFMKENGLREANLLPFHKFGQNKYDSLGMKYEFSDAESIPDDLLNQMKAAFEEKGFGVVLYTH